MQQVIALVNQILGLVNTILAVVQSLRTLLAGVPGALVALASDITSLVNGIGATVTSLTQPGGWLGAQGDKLDNIIADLEDSPSDLPAILAAIQSLGGGGPTNQDVLDAIAALRGGTGTIQDILDEIGNLPIPVNPPSSADNAAAVWEYVLPSTYDDQLQAQGALAMAGETASNEAYLKQHLLPGSVDFYVQTAWDSYQVRLDYLAPPTVDYGAILPSDTVLSWLTRTDINYTWYQDDNSDLCWALGGGSAPEQQYTLRCRLHTSDLQAIRLRGVSAGGNVPPVWPGLDGVTLGTPVAIAPGVTIDEAMDGVIVTITGLPVGAGKYQFDTEPSWLHMGAVAFYSDNADIEQAQSFSFEHHLLVPRTMAHAAGCYVRAKVAVTGTITPWVIGAGA